MRLMAIALAGAMLCGEARSNGLVQLHFQPDCELAQLRSAAQEEPLKFAGLATQDADGRHCAAAIAKPQFDKLFALCAVSAIQLRAEQADNDLCAVTYSSWQTRFEYRYRRSTDGLQPLCMFVCTRAQP